ncbi:glycosyltransferase family 4 protein [Pedobacter ghigonis]|uniref:glycosyltransferase family 4 protein n=1 Tax=Pedobacter ghigonis TaxID=2730403 RepID=UPI00158E9434|nr:glycosyltransferase family 4 protein [Pedobacter ghigonis]
MKKLAIILSHPIQYYSPLFQLLAKSCELKVFYTIGNNAIENGHFDEGFQKHVIWDIPLLSGYNYEIVENNAKAIGHHFFGIRNPGLINILELFQPNAILVYGWSYESHLKCIRYFSGKIPIWFRGDSTLLDSKHLLTKIVRKLFLTWVYKHIDIAFYVGEANKAYFEAMGFPKEKLICAPHAIDNDRFGQIRRVEALALRKSLGIDENEILILFAGKFEHKKNPKLLLNTFLQINQLNVQLLFIGNGALEQDLRQLASTSVAKNRIHFMDFQNQNVIPVFYQACDLFCLPSRGPGETWGLAVNEAMAAGKAILVSDKVGCSSDLVREGKNGYTFESENENELKKKLEIILKQDLKEMGNYSRKTIQNWSIERQAIAITNSLENK